MCCSNCHVIQPLSMSLFMLQVVHFEQGGAAIRTQDNFHDMVRLIHFSSFRYYDSASLFIERWCNSTSFVPLIVGTSKFENRRPG